MVSFGFAVYLVVIAVLGFLAWRRTRDITDYLLGGRRVGATIAALSAGASDMSGWLLLGLPGLAVLAPTDAGLVALGLLLGTWCNWRFVAVPLRTASGASGALTVPAFLAHRFPECARALRVSSALLILVFFLLYTSAGLVAGAKLFTHVFGFAHAPGVLCGSALILLYTLYGGFLAVAWTDAFQALLMSAALLAVAALLHTVPTAVAPSAPTGEATALSALGIVSALAWGLGYCGQPHILARFMAIAAPERVAVARRIAVTWSALGLGSAVLIGSAGAGLVAGGDPEHVFMEAIVTLYPAWLAGFLLAAILAAIMSTADSQLLVTAAALAEDLLPAWRGVPGTPAARLRAGRRAVLAVAVGATLLALTPTAGVFQLVARAWAGFGATLGPLLLAALYVPRLRGEAALAGLLVGAVVVGAWPLLPGRGYGLYELLPGFVAAALTLLAGSHWQARRARA